MAARRLFPSAGFPLLSLMMLGLCTLCVMPAARLAHAEEAKDDADSGKRAVGEINASSVIIRSKPAEEASNIVTKLDKGDRVTAVGMKFNFLKILPPKGTFCYVAKAWIQRHGDGKSGKVIREAMVRPGSTQNQFIAAVMTTLKPGDEVTINGEHDEYFNIDPPPGVYFWVHKQFVDMVAEQPLVKNDAPAGNAPKPANPSSGDHPDHSTTSGTANAGGAHRSDDTAIDEDPAPPGRTRVATTAPSTQDTSDTAATSQPVDSVAKFEKLEADFTAATAKEVAEQPIPELLTGYNSLVKEDALPDSMRRIAQRRIATLKVRDEFRQQALATKEAQAQMRERQKAMVAEKEELEERIKENDVKVFAAVGTLRTSSLQTGQGTLYRLTDPATGRTVCYVRTQDGKLAALLGQFIGVKGAVVSEGQLKQIIQKPTDAQPVDPGQVNNKIVAQVVPASLLPRTPQASTNDK